MQDKILEWLPDLIKESNTSNKNIEDVMINFADENKLAPAVLEKMAQSYNAAKVLNLYKTASNRGDSTKVINSADLLTKYANQERINSDKESSEVQPEDLSMWVDEPYAAIKAASDKDSIMSWVDSPKEQSNIREGFPRIHYAYQEKFASEETTSTEGTYENNFKHLINHVNATRVKEAYEQVVDDTKDKITNAYRQIEDTFRYNWNDLDFATVEKDATYMFGAHIQPTLDTIAKTFTDSALNITRNTEGAGERRLIKDAHNLMPLIDTIHQNLLMLDAARELRNTYVEEKSASSDLTDEWEGQVGFFNKGATTAPNPFDTQTPDTTAQDAQQSQSSGQSSDTDVNTSRGPKPQGKGMSKADSEESENKEDEKTIEYKSTLMPYAVDTSRSIIEKALDTESARNPAQDEVDNDVKRIKNKLVLENLLNMDDVLSQEDPQTVAQIYRELINMFPNISWDVNNTRLILREAVAYGGIPTQMAESLSKINKSYN